MKQFGLFLLAGALCSAGIVYTDFGPGQTYDTNFSYGISGASAAANFTPSATGSLGQIDLALACYTTPLVQAVTISLFNTSAGNVPGGSPLETWSLPGASLTTSPQIFTFTSLLTPNLVAGTQYWIAASTLDSNVAGWYTNTQGFTGKANNNGTGWQWQPSAAALTLDVIEGATSSVPEPATRCRLAR